MKTPPKFSASYLKLNRASKHLNELRGKVEAYLAGDPVAFSWESVTWDETWANIHPRDASLIGLIPRVRIPIPEDIAPIIGDVAHNLRSALDIMMFDLISNGIPKNRHRKISFPFWRCESSRAKAMHLIESDSKIASLVKAWEPYQGGRSRLYSLHVMWNVDKHRSIIPIMGGVEFSQGRAMTGHRLKGQELIDPFPVRKQVRDGRPYIVQQTREDAPPLGTEVPCVVRLALDGDAEIKGRDLIQELEAHWNVVNCVLESFTTGEPPKFTPPPPTAPVRVGPGQWAFPPTMSPDDVKKWLDENWQTLA